jgi:hypothetical protein
MRKLTLIILTVGLTAPLVLAQDKRVTVTFAPQNKNHIFDAATDEYRRIWAAEGGRIIAAMEEMTTLKFPERNIKAEIFEGPSNAGLRFNREGVPVGGSGPMVFRASYPAEEKKGTLVHELGHRMNAQIKKRPQDVDEHRLLFLYLYDLYDNLYGKEFADREVAFGKTLKGLYDYETAWNWALAMSRDERFSRFGEIVKASRK